MSHEESQILVQIAQIAEIPLLNLKKKERNYGRQNI